MINTIFLPWWDFMIDAMIGAGLPNFFLNSLLIRSLIFFAFSIGVFADPSNTMRLSLYEVIGVLGLDWVFA